MSQQISSEEPERMGIFDIWFEALTQPREETFTRIAAQPNATTGNALVWVFVATLITGMVAAVVQTFSVRSMFSDPFFSEYMPEGFGGAISIGTLACSVPIGAVLGVLSFAITVGIIQWVAKLFGGIGSFEKLAFVMAAISVPVSLISALFSLLSLIPYVNILAGLIAFAFFIYVLVLEVTAVKAVNYFGWGQAIGSVFLPVAALFLIACCCIAALSAMLGPVINDMFNTINQGLY
ncbi:MAG: Yip1 family protein [Chloroflexota bacterium]